MLCTADGEALKGWFVSCRSSDHLPQHLWSTNDIRAISDYITHKLMFLAYLHPMIFTGSLFHCPDRI